MRKTAMLVFVAVSFYGTIGGCANVQRACRDDPTRAGEQGGPVIGALCSTWNWVAPGDDGEEPPAAEPQDEG